MFLRLIFLLPFLCSRCALLSGDLSHGDVAALVILGLALAYYVHSELCHLRRLALDLRYFVALLFFPVFKPSLHTYLFLLKPGNESVLSCRPFLTLLGPAKFISVSERKILKAFSMLSSQAFL